MYSAQIEVRTCKMIENAIIYANTIRNVGRSLRVSLQLKGIRIVVLLVIQAH